MDILFNIPVFVSKNVSVSTASMLMKTIETVNISVYSSIFYEACYSVFYKMSLINKIRNEGVSTLCSKRGENIFKNKLDTIEENFYSLEDLKLFVDKSEFLLEVDASPDSALEISFKPSILKVKIESKGDVVPVKNEFLIGVKCFPIFIEKVDKVLKFINDMVEFNNFGVVSRLFNYLVSYPFIVRSKYYDIFKNIASSYSFSGRISPKKIGRLILRNIFGRSNIWRESPVLTYGIVVLKYELENNTNMGDKFYKHYNNLSGRGFGDFLVIDDTKETVTYCNHFYRSCDIKSFSDVLRNFGKEELTITGSSSGNVSFSPFLKKIKDSF